jgi:hypothetical protein
MIFGRHWKEAAMAKIWFCLRAAGRGPAWYNQHVVVAVENEEGNANAWKPGSVPAIWHVRLNI